MNPLTNLINIIKRKTQRSKYKHKNSYVYEKEGSFISKLKVFFLNRSRLGLLFFVFLVLFLFASLVFINIKAFIEFESRAYPDSQMEVKNEWAGNTKYTILLIGTDKIDSDHVFIDHVSVLSLDPQGRKVSILVLNPDLKVTQNTIGYTLHYRTILNNRELSEDKLAVLIKSVENLLAFKIDRYLIADKNTFPDLSQYMNPIQVLVPSDIRDEDTLSFPSEQVADWGAGPQVVLPIDYLAFAASDDNGRDDQLTRQQNLIESMILNLIGFRSVFNFANILGQFENSCSTNMGKWELFHLSLNLINIKQGDIKKGYLRESTYQKVIDIGFYEAISPDIGRIDKDLSNIFFDLEVFKEQARIEVLNGSGIKGLATNRSRWVVNIGARVIHYGNSYEMSDKTTIYCSDVSKYPVTIFELKRFLGSSVEIIEEEYPNRHVGDIVIVLGRVFD